MWIHHTFDSLLHLSICKEYRTMPRAKNPRNGTAGKKVAAVARRESSPREWSPTQAGAAGRRDSPSSLCELYQQRGCTPGRESEDWLLAEQEVAARYQNVGALAQAAGKD